jgi:hypothetical protein
MRGGRLSASSAAGAERAAVWTVISTGCSGEGRQRRQRRMLNKVINCTWDSYAVVHA